MKENVVKKLLDLDPLSPKEMIRLSNSYLKLLSHFPFDIDSLYSSVKKFIVGAHELACAKADVEFVDFNSQLDKTQRQVGILTAKASEDLNLLLFGNLEESLKAIDEEMEPLRSELSALEARKKAFRRIKSGMESNSKELLEVYN